jgi:hypothetical protein
MEGLSDQELLVRWDTERDMEERDGLYAELLKRRLFPSAAMETWEQEAGLYPSTDDPRFVEKLMAKQEFVENFQESFGTQQQRKVNPCDSQEEFELTPTQRFVSRFMSPQCPYTSALLFHGVGVGKTCAAITTAETFLEAYPHTPVFIVAPRAIQSGFRRTIYDENDIRLGATENEPNSLRGCTGSTYLKRAGVEFERDVKVIGRRVGQAINSRYKIMGYKQFDNYVKGLLERVPKSLSKERRDLEEMRVLRAEFSERLLIVDEAHNLRDVPGETDADAVDVAGGVAELTESAEGKALTPTLLRILRATDGLKLMLLTGTPMYNSYREIIFLLNLLLLNDKKATLSERDIFLPNGAFKPGGARKLGAAAAAYVSFMRGENPLSFPVRLEPRGVPTLAAWPTEAPNGAPVEDEDIKRLLLRLPFVPVGFEGEELAAVRRAANTLVDAAGLGVRSIDEMVQTGNWLFPGEALETRIRDAGFDAVFEEARAGNVSQFVAATEDGGMWLEKSVLKRASPKAGLILNRIVKARGVVFIYSRFIKSGALPLALALEANGYTCWGRSQPMLVGGAVDGKGRQCALCDGREKIHIGRGHKFTPAQYVLLTGQANYSPNNAAAIAAARAKENMAGGVVKVVIGSQVASEGIDLRFVREIYVFDSWFHLNKMEQVLGRGVRTCSHALLPAVHRNCTIHLLLNSYGTREAPSPQETADMYMYRNAMVKALQVGRVTRVLKQYALDCNLNRAAVIADDLEPLDRQEDSQGEVRENIPLNDTPYTSICDWMECPYTCAKPVDIAAILEEGRVDMSTYDEYAMRWREAQLKEILRRIFEREEMPMIQIDSLVDTMRAAGIPEQAIRTVLADVVGKKTFRMRLGGQEGYLVYRNTYYVFQPIHLADVRVPLALRVADIPVRKDVYEPGPLVVEEGVLAKEVAAPAAAEEALSGAPSAAAPSAAAPSAAPAAATPREETTLPYWLACVEWSKTIAAGTSELDVPIPVLTAIERRYAGDELKREYNMLVMISWMYEDIARNPTYPAEQRAGWLAALAQVLLEMVWDTSFRTAEQLALLRDPSTAGPALDATTVEQRVKKGSTVAYRFVVPSTGGVEYICADGAKCSSAVTDLFERDRADPINIVRADRTTAGRIYGMMLPKLKEGTIVFKTNDRPVDPGVKPEKGGECEIVSNIESHKKGLREIREMIVALGYPAFLLREEVLEEKKERQKETAAALAAAGEAAKRKKKGTAGAEEGAAGGPRAFTKLRLDSRKFQNVVKACALKQIVLRLVDLLEARRAAGKRYFFRPVAAVKAGHKLK